MAFSIVKQSFGATSIELDTSCAHHFRGIFQAMRRYTAVHLARIYPAGYRVDSSNYDPQVLSDVDVQSQDVMSWRM